MNGCVPAVDADHDETRNVEANTAGHDRIGGREVQSTRRILFADILLWDAGPVPVQRYGNKGDERSQQPDDHYCSYSDTPRHPASVSGKGSKQVQYGTMYVWVSSSGNVDLTRKNGCQ